MRSAFTLLAVIGLGLLAGCGDSDAPDDALGAIRPPGPAEIRTAQSVLDGAHVPTLDPVTMTDAEIRKVVGSGPRCEFRYTSSGEPVLAVGLRSGDPTGGVLKLNGSLIRLDRAPAEPEADSGGAGAAAPLSLVAGPIRANVSGPGAAAGEPPGQDATMTFAVGDDLQVGYGGYWECLSGSVAG